MAVSGPCAPANSSQVDARVEWNQAHICMGPRPTHLCLHVCLRPVLGGQGGGGGDARHGCSRGGEHGAGCRNLSAGLLRGNAGLLRGQASHSLVVPIAWLDCWLFQPAAAAYRHFSSGVATSFSHDTSTPWAGRGARTRLVCGEADAGCLAVGLDNGHPLVRLLLALIVAAVGVEIGVESDNT